MRTVQMTLDDSLVDEVDRAATSLGTTRSAFTREALRAALAKLRERELEQKHRKGYEVLLTEEDRMPGPVPPTLTMSRPSKRGGWDL